MILVQWSCEVPQKKLESFIRFTEDELKPFYESHGCKRWELFMPMEVEKKYFSYHTVQKANRYTEQLIFDSIGDFEKIPETVRNDSRAREIMENFGRKFGVSSCSFTILRKM